MNKTIKRYLDDYFNDINNYYEDLLNIITNVALSLHHTNNGQEFYEEILSIEDNANMWEDIEVDLKEVLLNSYMEIFSKPKNKKIVLKNIQEYFKEYLSDGEWIEIFNNKLADECGIK